MVAIPNHHFFQWVNQLKDSGYEIYWLDANDDGVFSHRIPWVTQIKAGNKNGIIHLGKPLKRSFLNFTKLFKTIIKHL